MPRAKASRTHNPLHFEDLDPHRFEDLVRQLVYGFRRWRSLEAIGRAGSDDGIDIRGIEVLDVPEVMAVYAANEGHAAPGNDRIWIVQCKREQSIGPSDIPTIVEASVARDSHSPHGFILAATANFSKRTRDKFEIACKERCIKEYHIWGKSELEDMIYDPKNAHLLFLYFDVSITGAFGRSKELANLRWELSDNVSALVMKSGDAPFIHTLWMNSLRERFKIQKASTGNIRLTLESADRLVSFWIQIRAVGRRLRTDALKQAIASGQFLDRGPSGEVIAGPTYCAMRQLLDAIDQFKWNEEFLDSRRPLLNSLIASTMKRQNHIDVSIEMMIYLFVSYDRATDIMRLSVSLLDFIQNSTGEFRAPSLSPISPVESSIEGIIKERSTHEDIQAWLTDNYMRSLMTGRSDFTKIDMEISRSRFPNHWKLMDEELESYAKDFASRYGVELDRRKEQDGPLAALNWFESALRDDIDRQGG